MCAYLIIAAELAILYLVFWYIYLREPKPFRPFTITGNPWGYYERQTKRRFTADGINMDILTETKVAPHTAARMEDFGRHRRQARRAFCHKLGKGTSLPKYGWTMEEPWQDQVLVAHILDALKSAVIELNVKVL